MDYTTEQLTEGGFTLSYRYYSGNKKETLFLFHGFAQSNAVFDSFAVSLLNDYSVISVDLFFHGESTVEAEEIGPVSIQRWNVLFDRILIKHQIDHFSLLSYSMGSRFVVTLLHAYASRITQIVFIAPDGFGNNFWFRVATSTAVTRFIFKSTMQNPAWIKVLVRMFGAVKIFNSITIRFIERNLESPEHRKNIYRSWVYFRKLTIPSKEFIICMRIYNIRFMCFCGSNDQLVAKDSLKIVCEQTGGCYMEADLAHHKMLYVLEMPELNRFLISDRQ